MTDMAVLCCPWDGLYTPVMHCIISSRVKANWSELGLGSPATVKTTFKVFARCTVVLQESANVRIPPTPVLC